MSGKKIGQIRKLTPEEAENIRLAPIRTIPAQVKMLLLDGANTSVRDSEWISIPLSVKYENNIIHNIEDPTKLWLGERGIYYVKFYSVVNKPGNNKFRLRLVADDKVIEEKEYGLKTGGLITVAMNNVISGKSFIKFEVLQKNKSFMDFQSGDAIIEILKIN